MKKIETIYTTEGIGPACEIPNRPLNGIDVVAADSVAGDDRIAILYRDRDSAVYHISTIDRSLALREPIRSLDYNRWGYSNLFRISPTDYIVTTGCYVYALHHNAHCNPYTYVYERTTKGAVRNFTISRDRKSLIIVQPPKCVKISIEELLLGKDEPEEVEVCEISPKTRFVVESAKGKIVEFECSKTRWLGKNIYMGKDLIPYEVADDGTKSVAKTVKNNHDQFFTENGNVVEIVRNKDFIQFKIDGTTIAKFRERKHEVFSNCINRALHKFDPFFFAENDDGICIFAPMYEKVFFLKNERKRKRDRP